jgi:hypothetical protein
LLNSAIAPAVANSEKCFVSCRLICRVGRIRKVGNSLRTLLVFSAPEAVSTLAADM